MRVPIAEDHTPTLNTVIDTQAAPWIDTRIC
jgi:hypothetical protein